MGWRFLLALYAEHALEQSQSPDEAQQKGPPLRNARYRNHIEERQSANFKNRATQGGR